MLGNQRAITLIEVVVTIIIIMIITGIAVYSGIGAKREAEFTEVYSEMKSVKNAVAYINTKLDGIEGYTLQSGVNCGTLLSSAEKAGYQIDSNSDYYILYGVGNLGYSKAIEDAMGVGPLKRTYIVSYVDDMIMLEEPITISQYTISTYDDAKYVAENGDI